MATQTQEVTQRLAPFQESFWLRYSQACSGTGAFLTRASCWSNSRTVGCRSVSNGWCGCLSAIPRCSHSVCWTGGAAAFANPYESAVVDQSLQDIARAGATQQGQLAGQATGAGARWFSCSRCIVELARGTLEQQGRTSGQLRASGFQQAQQAGQQAAGMRAVHSRSR